MKVLFLLKDIVTDVQRM